MEPGSANGSNNHVNQNPEDGKPLLEGTSPDFSTPSVSSPSNFSPEFDGNPSSRQESVPSPDTATQNPSSRPWSMTSTSPPTTEIGLNPSPEVSTVSPDLTPPSQMKSPPPVQTMGRPVGYDPNRIPSSIFSTKPSNPAEWSTNSNESLFSIQMGNNSFTQDHLLAKSGELPWLEDWNNAQYTNPYHGTESKSNEMSTLPTVMEVQPHEESSVKSGRIETEESVKSPKVENHAKEKIAPAEIVPAAGINVADAKGAPPAETTNTLTSSSTHRSSHSNPRLSDESGNSGSSFAFPVLVNDTGKVGSLKAVAEKPDQKPKLQEQVSKSTHKAPKTSKRKCFCCFSCLPKCC